MSKNPNVLAVAFVAFTACGGGTSQTDGETMNEAASATTWDLVKLIDWPLLTDTDCAPPSGLEQDEHLVLTLRVAPDGSASEVKIEGPVALLEDAEARRCWQEAASKLTFPPSQDGRIISKHETEWLWGQLRGSGPVL